MHTRDNVLPEPAQPKNTPTPTTPALPLTQYANTMAALLSLTNCGSMSLAPGLVANLLSVEFSAEQSTAATEAFCVKNSEAI